MKNFRDGANFTKKRYEQTIPKKVWNCPVCGQGRMPPKGYNCPECNTKFNADYKVQKLAIRELMDN